MTDQEILIEAADALALLTANLTSCLHGDPIDLGSMHELEQPTAAYVIVGLFAVIQKTAERYGLTKWFEGYAQSLSIAALRATDTGMGG